MCTTAFLVFSKRCRLHKELIQNSDWKQKGTQSHVNVVLAGLVKWSTTMQPSLKSNKQESDGNKNKENTQYVYRGHVIQDHTSSSGLLFSDLCGGKCCRDVDNVYLHSHCCTGHFKKHIHFFENLFSQCRWNHSPAVMSSSACHYISVISYFNHLWF